MPIKRITYGGHSYFMTDPHPSVLYLSRMHGDESESSKVLREILERTGASGPSYLFIPEVSPSAVRAKTRKNGAGHDINRQFYDNTQDPEARTVMNMLSPYRFNVAVDVHEDPDRNKSLYIYDTGIMTDRELSAYRRLVRQAGAELYTGMDDENDKDLGVRIEDGYISFRQDTISLNAGFLSIWITANSVTSRVFTIEIPGRAASQMKRRLIAALVPFLASTFGVQ